jgi:hypothetical protein
MFSEDKKHNSRGAFAKFFLPHHQTNDGCHRLTKTLMRGNFVTQKSRFTVAELEPKFRCGGMKRDYTKLTNLYTIHICAMKNF